MKPNRNSAAAGRVDKTQTQALDVHTHAMPLPMLRWLADRGLADTSAVDQEIVRIDPKISGIEPNVALPLAHSQHDVAARLMDMDNAAISHHAVSLPPFLFASTADDRRLVAEVMRRGNDALADYVAGAPDRLVGLGHVALGWAGAVAEAQRCMAELGMAGLVIGTRGGGRDLDSAVNEDFWEFVGTRRIFVFIHPSGVPDGPRLRDYYLAQLVGYPMETALAVARLVFSGVLERHNPVLCLAHGGGCLPALRGRLDLGWERKDVARTTPHPPRMYTQRLYYDTAVFADSQLRRLVDDYPGHVLLGTDHPFELSDRDPVATVAGLGLSTELTRRIVWDDAARLLNLSDATRRS